MEKSSFFKSIHNPYYIYSPNFTDKSAGIKALHYLCHALNEIGAEAYLIGCSQESNTLRTPLLNTDDIQRHLNLALQPIAIYPEVVTGNPFNTPHVVRWLLNKAGYLGGEKTFEPGELLYAFSPEYVEEGTDTSILSVPFVNSTIFNNVDNPDDENRRGVCFYAHKYLAAGGKLTDETESAISLCQDQNLSQQEIAEILRRSEYLLCFEPSSMILEARFCGCPVVMVQSTYLMQNLTTPLKDSGVSLSLEPSELKKAKESVNERFSEYQVHIDYCWEHVKDFYVRSQEEFLDRQLTSGNIDDLWIEPVLRLVSKFNSDAKPYPSKLTERERNLHWLDQNSLSEGRAVIMAERMLTKWLHQPTFHLIIVLNHDELIYLSDTFESLEQQLYGAWGLSIISSEPQPEFLMDLPDNIEWIQLQSSLNETINQAVAETGLDWIFQLMPGDKLLPHTLWSFADCINDNSDYRFIYSDEMSSDEQSELLFKPDFNLELLRSSSYLGRSAMVRRDTFEHIGGYTGLAYVDITDLAFHIYETWGRSAIGHIADVLYSAKGLSVDQEVMKDNELAVRVAHIDRQGLSARVLLLPDNTFQTKYLYNAPPLISVVVANKNNASAFVAAVNSLIANTNYPNYELLIVDQMSDIEDMPYIFEEFKESFGDKLQLLNFNQPNYSAAINYGVSQAQGDYVLVLSSLVTPVNEDWMAVLMSHAQYHDTGVVGLKTVEEASPHKVIHAGGVLGTSNDVSGLFCGAQYDDAGYMDRARLGQEYALVSSAAFIVNKAKFSSVGGLDEVELSNTHFCVADFCLKLKEQGYRNIWTPDAVVRQDFKLSQEGNGVTSFNNDGAEQVMLSRWHRYVEHESTYNRNLSLMDANYSIQNKISLGWREQYDGCPRIMAFPFSPGAIGEFRTRGPLNMLAKEGRIEICYLPNHENTTSPFIPSTFEVLRAKPDIVYLNNALQDEMFTFLQWLKAETDTFIVFSLDDLIISLPKKNDARRLMHKDIRHRLRRTLALCDRLIVSTQPLADAYAEFCDDIIVVPNSIDMSRWEKVTPPEPVSRDKLRVGWAGGELHRGDLDMIVELVKETAQDVDWVFMGMAPEELKSYLHEYHPFASLAEYPDKMASLDLNLAIAPLELHPFNEAKSNLRLLEYGVLGWPVICTDICPYQTSNPPVTRVENTVAAWKKAVRAALADPETLREQGVQLQKWVLSHYQLSNYSDIWFEAICKR